MCGFRNIVLLAMFCIAFSAYPQVKNVDTILPLSSDKVKITPLFHDSLSSSFHIIIPREVPLHKHLYHTEQVMILSGRARMQVGDKIFEIKKGDVVLIPKNTPHSLKVISKEPIRCISIQAPYFDGTDRILLNTESKQY
ncbi:MAG: cupin domain-containing protein [Bacteroidia bacterium]|nr:cupin domain-containing protein [Bacteroidia bacterium]